MFSIYSLLPTLMAWPTFNGWKLLLYHLTLFLIKQLLTRPSAILFGFNSRDSTCILSIGKSYRRRRLEEDNDEVN